MEAIMIYKISPDPSLPKRGRKEGIYQRGEIEKSFLQKGSQGSKIYPLDYPKTHFKNNLPLYKDLIMG
jgi:hypothetical protein